MLEPGSRRLPKSQATAIVTAPDNSPPSAEDSSRFVSPDHEREYRAFVERHPDIEAVEFLIVDPNGVMRG